MLYRAWQQPQRNRPLLVGGWGFLVLAHWPAFGAFGVDRGWALAAILPGLLALLLIIVRTDWRAKPKAMRPRREREAQFATTTPWRTQVISLTQQIVVVGLLSLSASMGVALAVYALLDASVVNRTISAAIVVLLLWPVLMVWSRSRDSLMKPALWFVGLSLGGWLFTPVIF